MAPILILHGWGSRAKNWAKVKELLEKNGIKVLVPDLPGFGDNPPLTKLWTIDDYVRWVKDFAKRSNLDHFFLLGHSFGGAISLKYALKFPGEIKKLILVDAAIIRVRRETVEWLAKTLKIFSFLPGYPLARKAFYKFIVGKSDYQDAMGATRETYLKAIREDLSVHLGLVSVPTVLIWGEKDDTTPLKDAFTIKDKISGAVLEAIPGVKHNPHTVSPELLVERITKNL